MELHFRETKIEPAATGPVAVPRVLRLWDTTTDLEDPHQVVPGMQYIHPEVVARMHLSLRVAQVCFIASQRIEDH